MAQSKVRISLLGCALAALLPALLSAQQFPLELRVQQDENLFTVTNGTQIQVAADAVGALETVRVTAINRGTARLKFSTPPEILGSTAFSVDGFDGLPTELGLNDDLTWTIRFAPVTEATAAAQFSLLFTGPTGSDGQPTVGIVRFSLIGVVPDISINYALDVDANVVPLQDGGALEFEPTQVNSTAIASVLIVNRGSGPGAVESIQITGDSFRALRIPLLPTTIGAGNSIQFQIRYAPEEIGDDTGTLEIGLGAAAPFTALLRASAVGSSFTYELTFDDQSVEIVPGTPVSMTPTRVGESSTATVLVTNGGSAEGTINTIGVSGPGYSVADLPFLPALVRQSETLAFTLNFEPLESGANVGRLRIGDAIFDLSSRALGPRLSYEYSLGDETQPANPGDPVIFSPLSVGARSTARFTVKNEGEEPATVASIGVVAQDGIFSLSGLPALPLTLPPSSSSTFEVRFTPNSEGLAGGQLLIDSAIFNLSGFGEKTQPLPGFQFTGPSGRVEPAQQLALGLELAEPYPVTLTGTLRIGVEPGELPDDPNVQFATGGREAVFQIAPNTKAARFAGGADKVRLQTGTTAAEIVVTPTFTTSAGLNLTPDEVQTLSLLVEAAPPVLLSLQAREAGPDTLELILVGYTTTRSLTNGTFAFTPAPNSKLKESQFAIDLAANSRFWFESIASRSFGGLFSVTIPFTLSQGGGGKTDPVRGIGSVSAAISNSLGDSNSLSGAVFQQP